MRRIITYACIFFISLAGIKTEAQSCNCWQTRDASFQLAPMSGGNGPDFRCDDCSTSALTLPFNFCFWGTNETQVYINTNGNITFGAGYTPFNPQGFPLAGPHMISAFWADVDTYDDVSRFPYVASDNIYYKITPSYMIIQWDSVGYVGHEWCVSNPGAYGNDSLNNTFQIIISNGTDPIIPNGNNVELCYKGMNWTTGADSPSPCADNGKGFTGKPATVGANEGDGVRFVQIGRFNAASNTYLGQYPTSPNYDGVYWLDNKSFQFNLCSGQIAPLTSGVTPCDTFRICQGDSTNIKLLFFTPIQNDSVWINLVNPIMPGLTVLSNQPGNTDSINMKVVGSHLNYGFHTVNLYGYDNQTPSDTSFTSFVVEVDSSPKFNIVVVTDTICQGDSAILTASGVQSYYWSTGSTNASIKVGPTSTQTYTVGLTNGKCVRDTSLTIVVIPNQPPSLVVKPDTICPKDSALLVAVGFGPYKWSTGQTQDSIWVKPNDDSTFYVVSSNRCFSDTAKALLHGVQTKKVTITASKDSLCLGDSTILTASGGGTYLWQNNNSTSNSIKVKPTSTTTYTLVTTFGGKCPVDTTIVITVTPYPVVTLNTGDVCAGQCALLTATGDNGKDSYVWSNGAHTDTTTVCPHTPTTYTVSVALNKCVTQQSTTIQVNNAKALVVCCDQTIASNNSVTLTADSAASYSWAPSIGLSCTICASVVAAPIVTTTYTVTGTDANGCTSERTVTVTVECNDFAVPNVFTPNNDGINDDLVIQAQEMTSFSLTVFDRWGKEVFKSSNPSAFWNGTDPSGVLVADGTYYYIISASCGSGISYDKKGFVQLMR